MKGIAVERRFNQATVASNLTGRPDQASGGHAPISRETGDYVSHVWVAFPPGGYISQEKEREHTALGASKLWQAKSLRALESCFIDAT